MQFYLEGGRRISLPALVVSCLGTIMTFAVVGFEAVPFV